MSMIVNHDVVSLMGQRIMQKNSLAMRRSLEKLSTGLRTKIADIDNTAGLAISETMRSRIGGMDKALNNSQDGISMIQTASGALEQTQGMLRRMRELSVQAANDTLTQQDRSYIQTEINEIRAGITRIADTTQFNRKRILSGDNAVLWSSTDNNVKAVINGGLRTVDRFGQKYAVDGNYRLQIRTEAGKSQVQKSDVFHVIRNDVVTDKVVNVPGGVDDVHVEGNVPAGSYSLEFGEGMVLPGENGEGAKIMGSYGIDDDAFSFEVSDYIPDNASILFEVTGVDSASGIVTMRASAEMLDGFGVSHRAVMDDIMVSEGGGSADLSGLFGGDGMKISLNDLSGVCMGGKMVVNVSIIYFAGDPLGVDIRHIPEYTDPMKIDGGAFGGDYAHYALSCDIYSWNTGSEISFTNYFLDSKTGDVSQGSIVIDINSAFTRDVGYGIESRNIAGFNVSYAGKVADSGTMLRDIDKFRDSSGAFILEQPKELTLTQGDGRQAKVMLYANDTLDDVAMKLNRAIAVGLGQSEYVDDASKFVSFVEGSTSGTESVSGTLVVRSVLAGKKGEITFSGNEDVLNALSLNTIQESEETRYNVTVRDAHTDTLIAGDVNVTGNRLVGVIHENVDVEFDPMTGIYAAWNNETRNFSLIDSTNGSGSSVILHLSDNTTVFQTGAGEGEDVLINIGDMRAGALGLNSINVMSREAAAESISVIDKAIDRVSMQQAKLGAAQNRLEHHIGHLTDETEALVEANSRIRDIDYASEILEFTKMNILMQSNTAMLAQANQVQQSVLMLFR